MNDILARKQALRQRIIATRSTLSEAERVAMSQAILQRLIALPAYQASSTVLAYLNFGAEFAAESFAEHALKAGKQLLLPKVDRASQQLQLYRVSDLTDDVAPGLWNIREPLPARCNAWHDLAGVDFILLPGVAFERSGGRLGYGGGFYDKLLARMPVTPVLAAAAFSIQLVDFIDKDENDRAVHWLITEQETIRCQA